MVGGARAHAGARRFVLNVSEAGVRWPAAQLMLPGVFPCVAAAAADAAMAHIPVRRYDIVVHLGLENETRGFELEVAASNALAANASAPAVLGGPALLPTVRLRLMNVMTPPPPTPARRVCGLTHPSPTRGGLLLPRQTVDLGRILAPPPSLAVRAAGVAAAAGVAQWEARVRIGGGGGAGGSGGAGGPSVAASGDGWAPLSGAPPAAWSRDAGTFYCNEVYYRSLHAVRVLGGGRGGAAASRGAALPVIFVHLPALSVSPAAASAALVGAVVEAVALSVAAYAVPAPAAAEPAFSTLDMVVCGLGCALGAVCAFAALVFWRCRPGSAVRFAEDKEGYFALGSSRWDATS